jgi:exosome complex component RRP40
MSSDSGAITFNSDLKGGFVLPGDAVASLHDPPPSAAAAKPGSNVVRLGTGVAVADAPNTSTVIATKAGNANFDAQRSKVWVDGGSGRRYDPAVGDAVVAVVTDRHAEEYRVDMAGVDTATLPALAFEGATKRNKPALVIGSFVYCRVTLASRDMECEVSCIEPGSSRSWVSGETLYGELKGGNLLLVSMSLAAQLQSENSVVLGTLGASIPFESAVGANGRVWVKSGTVRSTVLLCLLIAKADKLSLDAWKKHVARVLSQYSP